MTSFRCSPSSSRRFTFSNAGAKVRISERKTKYYSNIFEFSVREYLKLDDQRYEYLHATTISHPFVSYNIIGNRKKHINHQNATY